MALTPFPFNIGKDLDPRPSNRELSMLTTRQDFCITFKYLQCFLDLLFIFLRKRGNFKCVNDVK